MRHHSETHPNARLAARPVRCATRRLLPECCLLEPAATPTQEAARAAVARKGQPWKLAKSFAQEQNERARSAAARVIGADPGDVALIPSISYGVATAGETSRRPGAARVLVLEDDHSSPVFEWQSRAEAQGFAVETVARPADGDWTAAVLAAIDRKGAAPVGLASISWVHWSDGGMIDLDAVAGAPRRGGAMFLIDATHGVGVLALDVKRARSGRRPVPDLQVDARALRAQHSCTSRSVTRAAYRWNRRCPRPPRCRRGERRSISPICVTSAMPRRFDMGERDHFISMEMAAIGMEMVAIVGLAPAVAHASQC